MLRLFSQKSRPVHLGPYPLELLPRSNSIPDTANSDQRECLDIGNCENINSVSRAMPRFFQLYKSLRDGDVSQTFAPIPDSKDERAHNLKSACYFLEASMAGICRIPKSAILKKPVHANFHKNSDDLNTDNGHISVNPDTDKLSASQEKEPALGDENNSSQDSQKLDMSSHKYAIAIVVEYTRDPDPDDPGFEWIDGTQVERAALRAAEVAVALATYVRRLGWQARAHIASETELDQDQILLAAGLGELRELNGEAVITNPYLGKRFGVAMVSTSMELATDKPLAARNFMENCMAFGPRWWFGLGGTRPAWKRLTGQLRPLHMGRYPMEKIKRRDRTTTYINPDQIKRVPQRHEFFSRAQFGDLGEAPQRESIGWRHCNKEPFSSSLCVSLIEGVPLQYGNPAQIRAPQSENREGNTKAIKALCHYLGADLVGICSLQDHMFYSHNHAGEPIDPYHKNAIIVAIDQGQETMAGSCGDDWISSAQSMVGYMRGGLVTGVVAEHIRRMGWAARTHTMIDEDVLHIPILLNAGLGELSRIGELVLNPFLGPRHKCTVITTDLPLQTDKPVDFGLQDFCEKCNKCARECPVQAISHGKKILFNGYETWKQDVQKCASYRITNSAGALCGRCMVTCPFQAEGLLTNRSLFWVARKFSFARKWIARLDDKRDSGSGIINPVKKWWYDLEDVDGVLGPARKVNARKLNLSRQMNAQKQKIAVFPPELAPPPDAKEKTVLVDRKLGREAYSKCASDIKNLHSNKSITN
jgi:ferredoxin